MKDLKTSTLIRNGLQHLWDGHDHHQCDQGIKEPFLCHAIVRAGRGGSWARHTDHRVERRLWEVCDMIESRLFPVNNLHSWLIKSANISVAQITPQRVQEHRRKWALKMIAEFQRKGD